MEHDMQAGVALRRLRHGESRAAGLDGLLGAADALGHGGLRHQERRSDLRRGQPSDRAQRQRDLARPGQRRVAAQKEQGEAVIGAGDALIRGLLLRDCCRVVELPAPPRVLTADLIDQAAGCHRDQPAARAGWHALDRPLG
jgi:hypothetical protein